MKHKFIRLILLLVTITFLRQVEVSDIFPVGVSGTKYTLRPMSAAEKAAKFRVRKEEIGQRYASTSLEIKTTLQETLTREYQTPMPNKVEAAVQMSV